MSIGFHRRFLDLIGNIEHGFPVTRWRSGDVPVWPLARMQLYLDMHYRNVGAARPTERRFPWRCVARAAVPLRNWWRSRADLAHLVAQPHRAATIILGDGVSLDFVDGAWRDRFAEPIIADETARGRRTFLMQSGDLQRLPWHRATYAANKVASHGAQLAAFVQLRSDWPAHQQVLEFLAARDVIAPSLRGPALLRTATQVCATASAFEQVLQTVQPSLAFVVNYYSGLGPAFVLACRRQRILTVDLQHCPQEGVHQAYGFSVLPAEGYDVLPDVFWSWTRREAQHIERWSQTVASRHRAIHGGYAQLDKFLNDSSGAARDWDARFAAIGSAKFEREILVALQPLGGHQACWEALSHCVAGAPANWRWWIRRHPAAGAQQDHEYASLLRLEGRNVQVAAAGAVPLPALLRHMTALVSLASGAAVEAAAFGVPAFFLHERARDTFGELIARGDAVLIDVDGLKGALAALAVGAAAVKRRRTPNAPGLSQTLQELEQRARQMTPPNPWAMRRA